LGRISETGGDRDAALPMVLRARRERPAEPQAARLAAAELRLNLKLGRYARARALGDSLLVMWAGPDPAVATVLAGVSALVGHVQRTAELLRIAYRDSGLALPNLEPVRAPVAVVEAALDLFAYAALGAPRDTLLALERRVNQVVGAYVEPVGGRRTLARYAALDEPAVLAYPVLGVRPVHRGSAPDYVMEMQLAASRGDTAIVRSWITKLDTIRRIQRPGDVAIDGTYLEAWVQLQMGDSAAAIERLDASLNALPALGLNLVEQVPQAAGLVRAMAWRADLASRATDAATARAWAEAVVTLWSGADEVLQPTVARMRTLSAGTKR
ncbi:MAG: hypothetical protein ACREMF_00395, partial [Gemmatimonadales bacterium]